MDKESFISKDTYEYLTNFANDKDIINMLSVNKKFNDDEFFKRVLTRRYPLLLKFKKSNESFKQFYLRMVTYIYKLQEEFQISYIPVSIFNPYEFYNRYRYKKIDMLSRAAEYAGQVGDIKLVEQFLARGADKDYVLVGAARGGHLNLVKNMIEKGAIDFVDEAMAVSARRGNKDIVQFLIDKGANDFPRAIYMAAFGAHINLLNFLLEFDPNYNKAMIGAAGGGHIDIVEMMILKGANDFNGGLTQASKEGRLHIMQYMVDKGANDFNRALLRASTIEAVDFLIKNGATDLNKALNYAALLNNMEIVNYLIEKGATDLNGAMRGAASFGHKEIVADLIKKGANDLNGALKGAAFHGNLDIVKYLLEKGATDIPGALRSARGQPHVIEFLKQINI